MKKHTVPFQKTGYFSKLICDYLNKHPNLTDLYHNYPSLKGFKNQIALKSSFEISKREILVSVLKNQYKNVETDELVLSNVKSLGEKNTFTVTTGHQLNLFTGPLYFIYKIIHTINLAEKLRKEFTDCNFVPVYWMATEDHDFDEINYFNFKSSKFQWKTGTKTGAVGRLQTDELNDVFEKFSRVAENSVNAQKLKKLFKKAYYKKYSLAEATRVLVNELFGKYGLVILDADNVSLKKQFSPFIADEFLNQTSYKEVSKTIEKFANGYKIQVNPREINLFYLNKNLRERIVLKDGMYFVNNTDLSFTKDEILRELTKNAERFSPNVIMRPLYQEAILPNLAYIGGGGELAYWLQLKAYFDTVKIPFPILLLRNSVLLASGKQLEKLKKLEITLEDIFLKQEVLITKKVKELSKIKIDFTPQRTYLKKQFDDLKFLASQTDKSFLGAVNAQEKKQLNGIDKLEKRLIKAQKKKLVAIVDRIIKIQNELFPNQSLEERTRNFSDYYLELGENFIPLLKENLDPMAMEFSIIEY